VPRGDRSSATRDALCVAAEKVFLTRGLYGATVRQIASAAGLTVPALYYHFEGVDHLYRVLVDEARTRFRRLLAEAVASAPGLRARLRAIAGVYVAFGAEAPGRLRLLCADLFRPRDEEETAGLDEVSAEIRRLVEGVMADGIRGGELAAADARIARRLFMALLNGLLIEQAREPATPLLDAGLADAAVAAFLDGTATRAPEREGEG
jgi:AcrR family transcriptional regulator